MLQPEPAHSATRSHYALWHAAALAGVAALAWIYLAWMDWGMRHMDVSADWLLMPRMVGWGLADLLLVFLMWAIMMAGMMLPSAAPLLGLAGLARGTSAVAGLMSGYLLAWAAFSVAATLLQWGLLEAALISPMMASTSALFSAGVLIAAGVFQLTPLKRACLRNCRSPLSLLLGVADLRRWGWLRAGLRYGAYCVGCCWALMAVLFVAGVMNLLWVFLIAAYVALEKLAPNPQRVSAATGILLCLWGAYLLAN